MPAQSSALKTPRKLDGQIDWDRGWELWTDASRFYPSGMHRRRLVAKWLAPLFPRTVLEAGCGPGLLLPLLRQRIAGATFTGIDSAEETIAQNSTRMPWARWQSLDLVRAHLNERFDAVICSEVLEHIEDDEAALKNLVAMTGGHLLITVPTGPLFPLEQSIGHLRHYSLDVLCHRIESLGLRIVRAQAWGFPWMNLFKRAANLRPAATLAGFGAGTWSWPKKLIGATLTSLFYLNLPIGGPQILILARRD